jgi:hypothetical protein
MALGRHPADDAHPPPMTGKPVSAGHVAAVLVWVGTAAGWDVQAGSQAQFSPSAARASRWYRGGLSFPSYVWGSLVRRGVRRRLSGRVRASAATLRSRPSGTPARRASAAVANFSCPRPDRAPTRARWRAAHRSSRVSCPTSPDSTRSGVRVARSKVEHRAELARLATFLGCGQRGEEFAGGVADAVAVFVAGMKRGGGAVHHLGHLGEDRVPRR